MMGKKKLRVLLGVLIVGAMFLAACGSSSSSNTSSSPATTAASSGGSGGPQGLALANARVDAFLKAPTGLAITQPVKPPAKLKIAYVQCSVPVCESIGGGIKAAAQALGADLQIFPHKDTADTVQAAFQSAIQAKPDMVLASGNPRQWFEQQLAELNKDNIPVIVWSVPEGYQPPGFAANLVTGDDYYFNGVLMADYVASKTNGDANVLFMGASQFPVLATEAEGFDAEYKAVCPNCKLAKQDFTVNQILAGDHISAAVGEMQKDPNIDYIVTAFGDMLPGMPDAMQNAGFTKVKAVSQAGTPANYELIAKKQMQVADMGLPTEFVGWRAVDAGLRAIAGQDVGRAQQPELAKIPGHPDIQVSGVPLQILTADNITDPSAPWTPFPGYQNQFKQLWGLG